MAVITGCEASVTSSSTDPSAQTLLGIPDVAGGTYADGRDRDGTVVDQGNVSAVQGHVGREGTSTADGVHQPVGRTSCGRPAALLADDRIGREGIGQRGTNRILARQVSGSHKVDAPLRGHLIGTVARIGDPLCDSGRPNCCLSFRSHVFSPACVMPSSTCRLLTIQVSGH